ncbi:gamma-glutamylcyclotransferase family protein [Clostridium sp.]|uniref:gamma-glutamylcyclotransferase family protein n=1 Tax=Clostridium sp. TaxID=1506 RepID=UPI003F38FE58
MLAPNEKINIFVYGSLRTGFFNYDKYLKGKVLSSKKAKLKGSLFHMPNKGYPALLDGEDYVYGEVMEISPYEDVIKALDTMEGYYGPSNRENEYNRIILDVELEDSSETEKCYVYKYNRVDDEFIKHREYVSNGDWTTIH